MNKVFGLVEFTESILCNVDALGQSVDVSLAGYSGTLTLPFLLNDWEKGDTSLSGKCLLPPLPARGWKRGQDLICWGRPVAFPSGVSEVYKGLFEFSFSTESEQQSSTERIYSVFNKWLILFEQYVILQTRGNTRGWVSISNRKEGLELLLSEEGKLKYLLNKSPILITCNLSDEDKLLHLKHLKEAGRLASHNFQPKLQYRLLLEAYSALKREDYRKAIIEGATALEICLTTRIHDEFKAQKIAFGEKLLKKFRMLGGLFELARLLEIDIPNKDYGKLVLGPRNDVVHHADFLDRDVAVQLIKEVEELLKLFSPQLYENEVVIREGDSF